MFKVLLGVVIGIGISTGAIVGWWNFASELAHKQAASAAKATLTATESALQPYKQSKP